MKIYEPMPLQGHVIRAYFSKYIMRRQFDCLTVHDVHGLTFNKSEAC
jgi:hypothetical protein